MINKDRLGTNIGKALTKRRVSAVLGLMGPNAREVLSRAAPHDDVSTEALPFGMSKEIGVGYALCRASRVTYVGELGWELYIPTEFALSVYEELFKHGEVRKTYFLSRCNIKTNILPRQARDKHNRESSTQKNLSFFLSLRLSPQAPPCALSRRPGPTGE